MIEDTIMVFQKGMPLGSVNKKEVMNMTIDEAHSRYNIPVEILREYESWGLCGAVKTVMGAWQYDEEDIERLSLIMTLHDVGFSKEEVESYMRLLLEGENTEAKRMKMLDAHRNGTLDEIHFKQKQLDRLDYLRYKIRQDQKENKGAMKQ